MQKDDATAASTVSRGESSLEAQNEGPLPQRYFNDGVADASYDEIAEYAISNSETLSFPEKVSCRRPISLLANRYPCTDWFNLFLFGLSLCCF
jgi:hypothetical protein